MLSSNTRACNARGGPSNSTPHIIIELLLLALLVLLRLRAALLLLLPLRRRRCGAAGAVGAARTRVAAAAHRAPVPWHDPVSTAASTRQDNTTPMPYSKEWLPLLRAAPGARHSSAQLSHRQWRPADRGRGHSCGGLQEPRFAAT
eukprot:TRINITY_DN1349_c0_g2_i1.p2 TRINITY_DN1349_c0_g2~~TRINITY_DN1349_c0_g2_i1.p2  ORF type:complete len:145 (-),score=34.22 TRINITY_DN1349_c0_g2_i1:125-559(-)